METHDPHDHNNAASGNASANPSYALGQLARVLATSQDHPDEATRTRAKRRASDWLRVFGGMLSGVLRVGSRTPIRDAPVWATPRVVKGGFVTGALLAGGPLQPHEEALLATLPDAERDTEPEQGRAVLNAFYLTEPSLAQLAAMLESGQYRVAVPEEGALLAVAWLAQNGHVEHARAVLSEIGPYFDRLRFYPVPAPTPMDRGDLVHLLRVDEAISALRRIRIPEAILTQTEALTVWAPFEDRLVALFAETVEGPYPSLVSQAGDGTSVVEGVWPCQVYPEGWRDRGRRLLSEYERLQRKHQRCGKHAAPGSNLARLRAVLTTAVKDPRRLTGRDVGTVRTTLALIAAKRGQPGSARLAALRATQRDVAAGPTKDVWAQALAQRLAAYRHGLSPDDLSTLLAPVTSDEAKASTLSVGAPMGGAFRSSFEHLLRRATDASIEQHIAWGTIPSGETLARVVPHLTARVHSARFTDPALRRLDEALYTAFRRRRSLLLLNLQHQVKLDELPWVRALKSVHAEGAGRQAAARALLVCLVTTALDAFPEQVLPNMLLKEVRSLAVAAGQRLSIVDEVAADIFMGTFSEKFLRAAQRAGAFLHGTLYERYYGIDYAAIVAINDVTPSRYGPPTSPTFDRLCHERARAKVETSAWGRSTAANGAVIEQEQVLTTHNLAVLFDALDLETVLADRLEDMARRCFAWICTEVERLRGPKWGQLRAIKNAAYAWRQLVFFLSLPSSDAQAFFRWADEHVSDLSTKSQAGLRPLLSGLHAASLDQPTRHRGDWTPFYGWSADARHLMRLERTPEEPTRSPNS